MHPLIYGNWIEKNYFAFRMYDGDNDGIISSVDIGDLLKNLIEHCPMQGYGKFQTKKCSCILYEEVMLLYNFSLNENLLVENKKNRKSIDFMAFLFQSGLTLSCLVIEIQSFLLQLFKKDCNDDYTEREKQERRKNELLSSQKYKGGSQKSNIDSEDEPESPKRGSPNNNKRGKK